MAGPEQQQSSACGERENTYFYQLNYGSMLEYDWQREYDIIIK